MEFSGCKCCDDGHVPNFSNDKGEPEHMFPYQHFEAPKEGRGTVVAYIYPCTKRYWENK
jgi:hypothetical protein